ncbi:MAG: hypothetical protein WC223_13065 [Bacteroidales bacterium]|jgi:hypothetical protein
MKTKKDKKFDAVAFFRMIKDKLSEKMKNMSLDEQREFLRQVINGKIKTV